MNGDGSGSALGSAVLVVSPEDLDHLVYVDGRSAPGFQPSQYALSDGVRISGLQHADRSAEGPQPDVFQCSHGALSCGVASSKEGSTPFAASARSAFLPREAGGRLNLAFSAGS